jgi:hypothetical protein
MNIAPQLETAEKPQKFSSLLQRYLINLQPSMILNQYWDTYMLHQSVARVALRSGAGFSGATRR